MPGNFSIVFQLYFYVISYYFVMAPFHLSVHVVMASWQGHMPEKSSPGTWDLTLLLSVPSKNLRRVKEISTGVCVSEMIFHRRKRKQIHAQINSNDGSGLLRQIPNISQSISLFLPRYDTSDYSLYLESTVSNHYHSWYTSVKKY